MSATQEINEGKRFGFGGNWAKFLKTLDDERIAEAEKSLKAMLGRQELKGLSFLDAGSGSGLFSLAARRLGAKVHSFDFDPDSVACTQELRRRFFAEDKDWKVEQASVLDKGYLAGLGQFDLVYSWGVLHHTGAMWQALDNVAPLVKPKGALFIAIYNDQGKWSRVWTLWKKIYNRLPRFLRLPYTLLIMGTREIRSIIGALIRLNPMLYLHTWTRYKSSRGMSRWHDMVDWIGGYPFEVATPEAIFDFYRQKGFELRRLRTCGGGLGCNEFVFEKTA